MVSTCNCGLYLLKGLDGPTPSAQLGYSFPAKPNVDCVIPVVAGRYWIETVLDEGDVPRWIAIEPNLKRLVITGLEGLPNRVLIATVDTASGRLAMDQRALRGFPHGALFSRP